MAPEALVTVKRYAVVVVGETTSDPFKGTGVPFRFPLTALVDVHVRVLLPPGDMVVGFAVIPAVGACARAGAQNKATIPMNQPTVIVQTWNR